MNIKSLPGAVFAWLGRTRYKWLLAMVLLGLVLQENYPFSNFPMYSSFSNHTYFIHLADARGTALNTRQVGLSNSVMKKIFDRYRQAELKHFADAGSERVRLAEAAACQSLLRYLDGLAEKRPAARKLLPGLQVQRVTVYQKADNLVFETSTIARHR